MNKLSHSIDSISINKSLSILLNSGGFSFCINDLESEKAISFGKYCFPEKIIAPEFLLGEILRIFASDKELQQDFREIKVIHQNSLSTLVPIEFFDKTKLKQYLDFNIKTFPNDYIVFDQIFPIKANNVYIPYVNINNYLVQNFGEFEFKHHSTVLIERLLEYSKSLDIGFFAHVSNGILDIIVIKSNSLLFYNSFEYFSAQDFLYYILFVAEQLDLDLTFVPLTFLGEIKEDDENYLLAYRYIYKINFIENQNTFFENSDFSNHSNYLLVN